MRRARGTPSLTQLPALAEIYASLGAQAEPPAGQTKRKAATAAATGAVAKAPKAGEGNIREASLPLAGSMIPLQGPWLLSSASSLGSGQLDARPHLLAVPRLRPPRDAVARPA